MVLGRYLMVGYLDPYRVRVLLRFYAARGFRAQI